MAALTLGKRYTRDTRDTRENINNSFGCGLIFSTVVTGSLQGWGWMRAQGNVGVDGFRFVVNSFALLFFFCFSSSSFYCGGTWRK